MEKWMQKWERGCMLLDFRLSFSTLPGAFYPVNPVFSYFVETLLVSSCVHRAATNPLLTCGCKEINTIALCGESTDSRSFWQDGHLQCLKREPSVMMCWIKHHKVSGNQKWSLYTPFVFRVCLYVYGNLQWKFSPSNLFTKYLRTQDSAKMIPMIQCFLCTGNSWVFVHIWRW